MLNQRMFARIYKDLQDFDLSKPFFDTEAASRDFSENFGYNHHTYGKTYAEYHFPETSRNGEFTFAELRTSDLESGKALVYLQKKGGTGADIRVRLLTNDKEFVKQNNKVKWETRDIKKLFLENLLRGKEEQ